MPKVWPTLKIGLRHRAAEEAYPQLISQSACTPGIDISFQLNSDVFAVRCTRCEINSPVSRFYFLVHLPLSFVSNVSSGARTD